eukprot:TRINITY_DN6282_c0_g1_i11.p1 TRINITY_DN6282_c0_g1~~TRINITY_DN6282_c0_g1_i11.p1  ORF type:complete len:490 (-),score=85.69 TRINITY_DN6282_c0_g1_i11:600-2069(-)
METNASFVGTVLQNYFIISEVGSGAFGVTCAGKDLRSGELVAIKFERADPNRQILRMEVSVLKKLQAVRLLSWGLVEGWNFMVMGLLGENLSDLRKARVGGKFSILTALKLGIKIIQAVREVHMCGYIHRDIKPSNFVLGLQPTNRGEVYLIDFGLAKRFRTESGEVKQARDFTGFRGTATYASINAHVSRDLGRRDDLWSVFYLLVEFSKGSLPWKDIEDRDQVGEMKRQFNNPDKLVKGLPPEFTSFMNYLNSLDYSDSPNYDYLLGLLRGSLEKFGGQENDPFTWEKQPPPQAFLYILNNTTGSSSGTNNSTTQIHLPGGGTNVQNTNSFYPSRYSYNLVETSMNSVNGGSGPSTFFSNNIEPESEYPLGQKKFFMEITTNVQLQNQNSVNLKKECLEGGSQDIPTTCSVSKEEIATYKKGLEEAPKEISCSSEEQKIKLPEDSIPRPQSRNPCGQRDEGGSGCSGTRMNTSTETVGGWCCNCPLQ